MFTESIKIPCMIIRGGTSKGIFFRGNELPPPGPERDALILRAFGGVDSRQIDGLGGANSLTSKVAIIESSARSEADIDYTFGQVSFAKDIIDWRGNCGNLSAAAGLFAVDMGLVPITEPVTKVNIYNTNTNKLIIAEVPVSTGKTRVSGTYWIPGVPYPGSKIMLYFCDPAGSVTQKLLPTGNIIDRIVLEDGRSFDVSIVDAANPVVFVLASQLGLAGTELPVEIEARPDILRTLENIRSLAAEKAGIVADAKLTTSTSPAIPKIGFVSPAADYINSAGRQIYKHEVDLVARLCSMQKMHRAYMVTGAVCTGVAANIPGTVVWQLLSDEARKRSTLLIGNPYGPMDVDVKIEDGPDGPRFAQVGVGRTARMIMEGQVSVPSDYYDVINDN